MKRGGFGEVWYFRELLLFMVWRDLKVRYKQPRGATSQLLTFLVPDPGEVPAGTASETFRFSASVAAFGLLLRDSEYKGSTSYPLVKKYAENAMGQDPHGYRAEFVKLVSLAEDM